MISRAVVNYILYINYCQTLDINPWFVLRSLLFSLCQSSFAAIPNKPLLLLLILLLLFLMQDAKLHSLTHSCMVAEINKINK